jgi:hypothetical protein
LKNVEYAAVLPARRAPVQRAQLLSCAKESTIELRCLMNARAADQVFNLRQLIDFLQKQHPEALPRQRSEVAVSNVANAKPQRPRWCGKPPPAARNAGLCCTAWLPLPDPRDYPA